jgi:hypothetical protein
MPNISANNDMRTPPFEDYGKQPEPLSSKAERDGGSMGRGSGCYFLSSVVLRRFHKETKSEKAHAYHHKYDHLNR